MPLYNYACGRHGDFSDWRAMSEAAEPASCPSCGRAAPRTISAPTLALMDGSTRKAHSINERSADEPRVARKGEPEWSHAPGSKPADDHGHDHPHGHGHGHHHGHSRGHRHGPSRPWMIGH